MESRIEQAKRTAEGAASCLGAMLGLLLTTALFLSFNGIVREHCLNVAASNATQSVQVDSHWTYILWPPLVFSSVDPPGRCVRVNPLREGLSAAGIWRLPSAHEQVRRHILDQRAQAREPTPREQPDSALVAYGIALRKALSPLRARPRTLAAIKKRARDFAVVARRLTTARVPARLRAANARLVRQLKMLGSTWGRAVAAFESGDREGALRANVTYQAFASKTRATLDAIGARLRTESS